jgi:hypothetical protein
MSKSRRFHSSFLVVAALWLAVLGLPAAPSSASPQEGYDLLLTPDDGQTYLDVAGTRVTFRGLRLNTFTFADGTTRGVGAADTVVRRDGSGSSSVVPIELVALRLVSTGTPVPLYVTENPALRSLGEMTLDGDQLTATLTVNYVVRLLSPSGPSVYAGNTTFTTSGGWGTSPLPRRILPHIDASTPFHRHVTVWDAAQIPVYSGVNSDFFPGSPF